MHEGGVAVGQRQREPGRQHRTLARGQLGVDGGPNVGAGVAGQRVRRERHAGVETLDQHLDGGSGGRRVGRRHGWH